MRKPFDYNFKYDTIKNFVTFKYDRRKNLNKSLSKSQKAELTRYYNALANQLIKVNNNGKVTKKQGNIYRPRKKENLKIAQTILNTKIPTKKLKALPIPDQNIRTNRIKRSIKIRKNAPPKLIRNGKAMAYLELDVYQMVTDHETYLRKLLKNRTHYDFYEFAVYGNVVTQSVTNIDDLIALYSILTSRYKQTEINGLYAKNAVRI